jgi:glycosyltransferase involved in cell wall biosynthesis
LRIAVVGVLAESIVTFRGEMLRSMAAHGHTVLAMAPEDDAAVTATLDAMGVGYLPIPLRRTGMNPARDARACLAMARAFRQFRPDIVLVYAAKPVIYGLIAARLARVPTRVAMITGVGSVLASGSGWRQRALSGLVRMLYRVALLGAHVVFFQNPDNLRQFRQARLITGRNRVVMINGSGVDLGQFAAEPLPVPPLTFLMVARLIRDKGIHEYVAAARRVREEAPEVRCQLLGPLDSNPTALGEAELEALRREGAVTYLGETSDVRPFLSQAHVCVLPSYHEGMPRSVLEAMAMGRAILTTDVPGCRETVEEGRNGYLVPVRDPVALGEAMIRMSREYERLADMGAESRRMAEARFDVRAVNHVILGTLGLDRPVEPAATQGS